MSEVLLRFRRREIRQEELSFLRQLIAENPKLNRAALSRRVCQAWNWVQPNGHLCAMVCRSLMLALHRAGHLTLPMPRRVGVNNAIRHRRVRDVATIDTAPLVGRLALLGGLEFRQVRRGPGEDLFGQLLSRHHYLGYSRPVGEHLKYLVYVGQRPIAALAWSSAPLQLNLRDQFVGAPKAAYQHNLHLIAYNTRFLIVPWAKVPHLASHLLAQMASRIGADWQKLYCHPIHLLESFVDIERFQGTCYRAANWTYVGRSQGVGTKSKSGAAPTTIKELWAYPLCSDFRQRLRA